MKLAKLLLILVFAMEANAQDYNLIIGTYTNTCESEGIYIYDFNAANANFKQKDSTRNVVSPSYLTVSPDNKFIYSVNENGDDSSVSAFKFNAATGKIQELNKKDSEGASPCYIINDNKNVLVANYGGGSIAVFEKKDDGSLGHAKQVIKHSGSSVDKERQEAPHVHMVRFSPDKKHVFCNDLGTDKIYIYNYNPDGGSNTLTLKETVSSRPGSGPRHLVFHPNGIFVYVLHELDGLLSVYNYSNKKMTLIQEATVEPKDFMGKNGGADIHFSKDGKFLYATNRGDANTISVFRVHANGMMNLVQQISTQGSEPRGFAIDPTDNYLLVGHQKTNNVVIFKRDKTTGMLTDTGKVIEVCAPVCLVFTPKK